MFIKLFCVASGSIFLSLFSSMLLRLQCHACNTNTANTIVMSLINFDRQILLFLGVVESGRGHDKIKALEPVK